MKNKILVVEDEKPVREFIETLLEQIPTVKLIGSAATVKDAIECVDKHKPEIILLDIEMPDGSGFDIIRNFEKPDFRTIVVTAHNRHAIQALKLSAVDYILKPFDLEELQEAIERTQGLIEDSKEQYGVLKKYLSKNPELDRLVIPSDSDKQTIMFKDILYLRSDGGYTVFYIKGGGHIITSRPIAYYQQILPENFFFRTHKSYMVNFIHVLLLPAGRGGEIPLTDGNFADLSVRRASEFRKWYKERALK